MRSEASIERAIKRWSESEGWLCFKIDPRSWIGAPDRIFMRAGKVVFVELKRADGKLRPKQREMIRRMRDHGINVHVTYSLEQTKAVLLTYSD